MTTFGTGDNKSCNNLQFSKDTVAARGSTMIMVISENRKRDQLTEIYHSYISIFFELCSIFVQLFDDQIPFFHVTQPLSEQPADNV